MKTNPQINADTFPEGAPIRCRYLRVKQVLDGYPLRTTTLYKLISERKIKSFVLRDKGAERGIRLVDRESLGLFFEMSAKQAEDEAAQSVTPPSAPAHPPAQKSRRRR
jgi:hypothetical protein